ncbi:hypothetical protein CEXT_207311 [Caerostris extrusa]|uniref:Uncharacterized protein n=1 Tax=Caerostris extrusa TaxID=172846 RepID=A0AAV4XJJ1_CAEEX|nr:hypothetical protein CEXT_207311 [Caerostris extrusa]
MQQIPLYPECTTGHTCCIATTFYHSQVGTDIRSCMAFRRFAKRQDFPDVSCIMHIPGINTETSVSTEQRGPRVRRVRPLSGQQVVTLADYYRGSCLWKILSRSPSCVLSQQVIVNDAYRPEPRDHQSKSCLETRLSNQVSTVVGQEYEVVAHSGASTCSRSVGPENLWQFVAPYTTYMFPRTSS